MSLGEYLPGAQLVRYVVLSIPLSPGVYPAPEMDPKHSRMNAIILLQSTLHNIKIANSTSPATCHIANKHVIPTSVRVNAFRTHTQQ